MKKVHGEVGANVFFVKEGVDVNIAQVKQEVEPEDI